MSIFDFLSFDIKEFATSTEGLCIIAGILLLLVGIIYAVATRGKKKDAVVSAPIEPQVAPMMQEQLPTIETPVMSNSIPTQTELVKEEVPSVLNIGEPVSTVEPPIVNEIPMTEVTPFVSVPVAEVTPVVKATPYVNTPVVEQIPFVNAPVTEVTPVVEQTLFAETPTFTEPVLEPIVQSIPEVSVYGGVSPVINPVPATEIPRAIYGGANPLENTAPIPTNTLVEAYRGSQNDEQLVVPTPVVTPVEPMVLNELPTTVEAPKEEIETLEF